MSIIVYPDRALSARHSLVEPVLARAAVAAGKAPTLGPDRPWCWQIVGDRAELHRMAAPSRAGADEPARQLVSCGSALHHAVTALAGEGALVRVAYLPRSTEPTLLAVLTVDALGTPTPADVRGYQSISLRASAASMSGQPSRSPLTPAVLTSAAETVGARLRLVEQDPGCALIEVDPDGSRGWLRAGEALSAVTLAAVQQRLTAIPDGPATHDAVCCTVPLRIAEPGRRFATVRADPR